MKRTIAMMLLTGALSAFSAVSYGAAVSVSDVTLNGENADQALGVFSGNINKADDLQNLGLSGDFSDFTLIGDAQAGGTGSSVTVDGIRFTLSADSGKEGDFVLTAQDVGDPLDLPAIFDLILGLKASNSFALYFFDDIRIDAVNVGTFEVVFLNRGGQIPNLSHLILFAGPGENIPDTPPLGELPEPSGLALLGLGIAALGMRRRTVRPAA